MCVDDEKTAYVLEQALEEPITTQRNGALPC
jgi:hypothetical protein